MVIKGILSILLMSALLVGMNTSSAMSTEEKMEEAAMPTEEKTEKAAMPTEEKMEKVAIFIEIVNKINREYGYEAILFNPNGYSPYISSDEYFSKSPEEFEAMLRETLSYIEDLQRNGLASVISE